MKAAGIVAEYNPFHNGHLYHIEQTRNICSVDYIICVMSGNFIQRGEPAIANKWTRAEMALLSGVDLVIEIPVVYAMASAEFFAWGAVKILDSLGIVNYISFGSETGEINQLDAAADILAYEPDSFKLLLKGNLKKGLSFPSAREEALKSYCAQNDSFLKNADIGGLLGNPNNILGIEYLKALKKLNSKIEPIAVKRIHNSYNSMQLTGKISSATSIREDIKGKPEFTGLVDHEALPSASFELLIREFENGKGPVFSENFSDIILSTIRKMTPDELKEVPYVSEGLENRIKSAANTSGSFDEMLAKIVTKRYTATRIKRCIFSILTGMKMSELLKFNSLGGPQYIRVLGFNKNGRQLLSKIRGSTRLPIIIKTADFTSSCNPSIKRMLEIEAFSTDMYVLGYKNPDFKKAGQEFTQNVRIVE